VTFHDAKLCFALEQDGTVAAAAREEHRPGEIAEQGDARAVDEVRGAAHDTAAPEDANLV
jgi:hypothetical protein